MVLLTPLSLVKQQLSTMLLLIRNNPVFESDENSLKHFL